MIRLMCLSLLFATAGHSATIAIIDTGFDLDHNYLAPKLLKGQTDEEVIDFYGLDFFDNSHLKTSVIQDRSDLEAVLRYRDLRAKGHRQGLSLDEFNWYKKRNADKSFMEKVRRFKKHSHGTIVAGIALREGENISIFPIRGLNLPNPVVAVEGGLPETAPEAQGKTPEERFRQEIKLSRDRISEKFSRICRFVAGKRIEIVNASYGITFKNVVTKFRERYRELTGGEIAEPQLMAIVDEYFRNLYESGERTMRRHPNMLFIFSAGNSGLDNDSFHHYPSRIKVDNAIAVAAMNGEFLATFSNFGLRHVDIGAPGVAIPSIIPTVYGENGKTVISPASGTSMAAPYVANIAAQIKNTNPALTPAQIRRIILGTGEIKDHLKSRLVSGAIVDNTHALRAALLSKDLPLEQAISLGASGLIPMEDKISIGLPPAVTPEQMQRKLLDALPSVITPADVDEDLGAPTSEESSLPPGPAPGPRDSSGPPPSAPVGPPEKSDDQAPASQSAEQSPLPSAETAASLSEPPPSLPETPAPTPGPSSP